MWDEIELPDLDAVDWRTAATRMATGLYAMLARHPWLVQGFGSYLFFGPGKARYDDHTLAVYEAAGFVGADADRAAGAVFTFVLGNALGAAATVSLTRRLSRSGENAEELLQETMAKAAEVAERFPRLRTRLSSSAAADYAGTSRPDLRVRPAGPPGRPRRRTRRPPPGRLGCELIGGAVTGAPGL